MVATERLGWATGRVEASGQRSAVGRAATLQAVTRVKPEHQPTAEIGVESGQVKLGTPSSISRFGGVECQPTFVAHPVAGSTPLHSSDSGTSTYRLRLALTWLCTRCPVLELLHSWDS